MNIYALLCINQLNKMIMKFKVNLFLIDEDGTTYDPKCLAEQVEDDIAVAKEAEQQFNEYLRVFKQLPSKDLWFTSSIYDHYRMKILCIDMINKEITIDITWKEDEEDE